MLTVTLLGDMKILRDGMPIELPRSRKARALLAFLAATGRAHRRELLCALLWDDVDDPRGSLRWNLSQIRALSAEAEQPLTIAEQDSIAFDPRSAVVDLTLVRSLQAADMEAASTRQLQEAVASFRGPFLDGLELPENPAFQSWCAGEREDARQLHARLRIVLADRLAPASEDALLNARELVRIDSHSEPAWSRLIALLLARGRRQEARQQYAMASRALRAVGGPSGPLLQLWSTTEMPPPVTESAVEDPALPLPSSPSLQETRFCVARDGVAIAYASKGTGPPLVRVANWMTHLQNDELSPVWAHWERALSRDYRLVRYDQRGSGMSDWAAGDFSFDMFVADLETVIDAVGDQQFAILAVSQGCAVAIAYAARHPQRVSHLVLLGGFARGWMLRAADDAERRRAIGVLLERDWGRDNPAVRQMFTTLAVPDATPEQMQRFNDLQRSAISASNVARVHHVFGQVDVRSQLAAVRCPTLVLHAHDDGIVPFDEGRGLAAGIADARFVALDSRNHILLENEPAWPRFLNEVHAFLSDDQRSSSF